MLRWKHPTQGYVSPERFIEVAEETGLIIPIGQFVLDRICRDITTWREQGAHLVPVSMNVSAVQLERTKLRELIQQAMAKNRIGPQLIALELTEGSLFETRTGEFREDALASLRDLGVKIAIDDFGTGYSSLVVPQALARGLAEDRPQLRERHRHRRFGSRHRQRHRRHGAQPQHPGRGRGHRDLAAAGNPAQHGLQPRAGIPVRQALRGQRSLALPARRATQPARERLAELHLPGRNRL